METIYRWYIQYKIGVSHGVSSKLCYVSQTGTSTKIIKSHCGHGRVHKEWAARVRAYNYVKFETGRNLPPVLKIVTRPAHAVLT